MTIESPLKSHSEISYRWCLTTLVVKRIWLSRPSRWCCFVAPRRLVRRSVGSRLMGQDAKRWRTLQNGWFMMVYEWFKIWHMQKWLILWAHVSHITAKFDPFPNRRNFTAAPPLQCPLFRHRCAAQDFDSSAGSASGFVWQWIVYHPKWEV